MYIRTGQEGECFQQLLVYSCKETSEDGYRAQVEADLCSE